MKRRLVRWGVGSGLVLGTVFLALASSHREAPLISSDPLADNTDVYAFVSPDATSTVTFVANWIPLETPAGGPNFYKFGDDVLYRINIDNNGDAEDDIVYEFRFTTQIQNPNTFLYNTGVISSLTDPHFNVRQTYSVTRIDGPQRTLLGDHLTTPPVNVGARSTPNYDVLADAAIHTLSDGSKVFAGQRDDPFFVDLGSVFDLLGLRPFNTAHVIPFPTAPGVDGLKGFNVHTVALQVPEVAPDARRKCGHESVEHQLNHRRLLDDAAPLHQCWRPWSGSWSRSRPVRGSCSGPGSSRTRRPGPGSAAA